ncbi:hypothetical protein [Belliella aquatica]|uniref:Lipoprotein n=1 Tax=Belliella aquatica TaxID=1323734 RepID=A0ABQ1LU17_9BACT|nr:hypothetical protein [Belliella aquatica]MCH7407254.1 hypothetical protein [Belliella aquatica]GGC29448.1 hypothetical protein GCM10010993_05410 [Belliella aquatica]
MRNSSKKIALFLFVIPFLFSCTAHYVATWQNYDEGAVITENNNYTIKNDTIGVSHIFNNPNGSISLRIENYTDQSMLINLTKSALVINGKAYNYIDGKSTFFGRLDYFASPVIPTTGTFEGEISSKTNTIFIPAKTYVTGQFTNIRQELLNEVGDNYKGVSGDYPVFNQHIPTKIIFYKKEESPLNLTSNISYSILDDKNNPVFTNRVTQSYYLSRVAKANSLSNQQLNNNLLTREDMSSYSITKGENTAGVLILLGIVGLAVLAADVDEQ